MAITTVLFDLDNTLYSSTSGVTQLFDTRITEYVQNFLGLDMEAAREIRRSYFNDYGTTLRGLQQRYTVDVEHYLAYVHDLELGAVLALDAELDRLLDQLVSRKAIFTNSPAEHAERVLRALGIERHFDRVFDIRFSAFEPKPLIATYHRVLDALEVTGSQTIFIEDTAQNLVPARGLGMTTILISEQAYDTGAPPADYVVKDIFAALQAVRELEGS